MKKKLALFLAALMAMASLAGCGGTTAPPSSSATATQPSSTAATGDLTAEITWWSFPTFDDKTGTYDQKLIDAFNEKYPNITVKLEMIDFTSGPEKITTAIQGNTAPDVLFDAPGRIVDYGKSGVLANLNDLFTDEMKNDVGNPNIVEACGDGENYWMYPLSVAPFVMAYNKTLLEKEGLLDMLNLEGDRTWTTDEFTALNEALAAKGHTNGLVFCMDQGGDQGTRALIANLYSSSITNDSLTEYTINDANGVKAMQYVMDQVAAGNLGNGASYNGGGAIEQFVAGTVSSALLWSPGLDLNNKEALAANGIEAVAVPLPSDNGKPNATEYLVNGFCVFDNGDADKIAASKLFVEFVCDDAEWGPKNVVATNCFPARQSYGELYPGNENMAFYGSLSQYYGVYYNTIDGFASMRPAWFSNVQAALTGDKTAEQAMNDFVQDANKAIEAA
ncbi:extracellular solute-binding protein [Ruminococcaceae bacterium OttesenSCG-928-A16]|nr:extracellular solute-binding protein [Ruminococcaceae bacterium OttesenSCG-928-A16]